MTDIIKEYSNGEITVVWKPKLCTHSTACFRGLPDVFKPAERPWVKINGSTSDKIIEQVNKCPSGALSYYKNESKNEIKETEMQTKMTFIKNGPVMIEGNCVIIDHDGNESSKNEKFALCRCGGSSNKPFCDGTHRKNGFTS